MTTKISLLSVLIAEVLFSTTLYSLPGPDDYKKTTDDVKKATASSKLPTAPAPEDVNKALNAAKAPATPTFPGPNDYKKTADDVKKATGSSKAGALPAAPAPEDVNKALNAAKGNPDPDLSSKSNASSTSTQPTNRPYTFYDRYTPGSQKPNSTSTSGAQSSSVETHESSWSETEDWHKKHKKNKHHHHGGDQDQFDNVLIGDYQQVPSQSHSHSASHKTANSSYDGSPIHYNKPKPTSDQQWKKTADDAQGRYSVDFDAIKSSAPQTQTWHTSKTTENSRVMTDNDDHPGKHKNNHKHGHHHDDD